MDDAQFERVATVYCAGELAVLQSRLRWEDIWSFAHSAHMISVDPGITVALGGVGLFVHREDAADAHALLSATPAWERAGGVFARNRAIDWAIAILALYFAAVPPPARLPARVMARVERQFSEL